MQPSTTHHHDASSSEWWLSFYDDVFADAVLAGPPRPGEVEAIGTLLGIGPSNTLFDQCCGIGRLSGAFADAGLRVVGVDAVPEYIQRATEAVPSGSFYADDARSFRVSTPCDAAINWYSSFGNLPSDDENIRMLRRAWESLRPGGMFALELGNLPFVLRHFEESFTKQYTVQGESVECVRTTELDLAQGLFHQTWTYHRQGRDPLSRAAVHRMYLPDQLGDLARSAGFEDVQLFADPDQRPLSVNEARCVLRARRPG